MEKHYPYWKHHLWSGETKLQLLGSRDAAYVWRKKVEVYNPQNTTVKHSGGSIKVWGCFRVSRTGKLFKVKGIMKKGGRF